MLPSPLLLDPSAVLRFVFSALLVLSGALFLVRRAASRYFFVGDDCSPFASAAEDDRRVAMSIGGAAREGGGGACAACGNPGRKTCSRCKGVRYCSEACQTRHWDADHKSKCKKTRTSNDVSPSDIYRRRKSSGFSSICLVPARGTCMVLQEPKKILFPYDEFLKLFNWDKPGFPPCGLLNCGNSCFANVVLQSLACTRPLTAYLLERDHNSECVRKHKDWCFLCELQVHIRRASASSLPFSPINILSRLPNIGGNLGYGRQEDAHEFMRFAIDTMQSICLDEYGGEKALDPSSRETTLIQHIFGGHLQSQVICTKCNTISNRYENMMDLTVEIQGDAESLEECLDQFTIKEWLDGDNMYKCDGCNDYVKAWKRLTIHQAPNILTIALKRFQSGRFGKLNKRVIFPENLDLTPYMSSQSDGNDQYTLYAVVVHVDMLNASFFGHYICYTKDYSGQWYRIDDCKVMTVEVEEVLSQGAYMLLYSRKFPRPGSFIKSMEDARKTHSTEVDSVLPSPSKGNNHIGVSACGPTGIGSQSNVSPTKRANDGSVLLAARCENELIMDSDTENVPPSVHIDDPKLSSSGSENLSEKGDILPVNPMQSDSFPSVMVSSSETQEMDCQEIHDNLDADCCLESNRLFCDTKKFTPYGPCFPKDVDTEMSEATSASITMSVPAEQALDDLPPKLKQTEAVLHPTNSVVTDSEAKVLESSPENGSSRRPKPMFSRGFLDGPARRKPALPKGKAEVEVSRAVTLRNANGCSNGYSVTDASQLDICANDARLSSYTGSAKDSVCRSDFAFISKAFPNGKQVNEENIVNDDSHHSRKADCSLPSDLASPCQNGNEIISLDDEKQVSLEELAGSERETAENLSGQSDHVHNASSNTLSEEGKCTSSRTDFTFMSRGFLNVSHKKQSKPKIARKDLDKMGHPCAAVSSRSINGLAPGENGTLASQDTPHPSEIQSCTRLKN